MSEEDVTIGSLMLLTLKLVAGALVIMIVVAALLDQLGSFQ
jgi:hypothetical protein